MEEELEALKTAIMNLRKVVPKGADIDIYDNYSDTGGWVDLTAEVFIRVQIWNKKSMNYDVLGSRGGF